MKPQSKTTSQVIYFTVVYSVVFFAVSIPFLCPMNGEACSLSTSLFLCLFFNEVASPQFDQSEDPVPSSTEDVLHYQLPFLLSFLF